MACFVPCSSTVVKCNGRIYDRNEDGDMDITDSLIQVEKLYARKIGAFNEHKIFPFVEESDLRMDLLPVVPGYITDALYRVENTDCYDDRLRVQSNLIESYDQLMKFIQVHTSDKFFLINNNNTLIRGIIAREVVANFFTVMGRSETIAFGVKNLYQLTPIYSDGGKPVLFEDDILKIEIPLNKKATDEQKSRTELTERESKIRDMILQNKKNNC